MPMVFQKEKWGKNSKFIFLKNIQKNQDNQ